MQAIDLLLLSRDFFSGFGVNFDTPKRSRGKLEQFALLSVAQDELC